MTVDSPSASRSAVLEALQRPIDPRHFKTRRQGSKELTYVPWSTLVRCLQHRAPGYSWELKAVTSVGDWVTVTGRLTIPTTDGPLVTSTFPRSRSSPPVTPLRWSVPLCLPPPVLCNGGPRFGTMGTLIARLIQV